MARKKIKSIMSLGSDENKLLVQKSRPLFALWQSDLTLAEFKILDTYLSRIDSHKPDKRSVVFEKGELEELLGLKQIKPEVLDERLKHLMTTVKIEDNSVKRGFTRIALFEKAVAEQDDCGTWKAELMCTQSAMKYIFNVDNLGYLRYKLRCITSITSRYTYILFIYLESNRYRKSWRVDLEELKNILKCDDSDETLKEYKYFNRDVLKRVQKEMHEKTECRFFYKSIKKGRTIVSIEFTLETLPKLEEINPNQIALEDYENSLIDTQELWQSALCRKDKPCEFTKEGLEEIFQILVTVPNYKMPHSPACFDSIELQRYHYIAQQFAALNCKDTKSNPIKNRFAYFVKMLKSDTKTE